MINRKELITRHNPVYTSLNKDSPLSVGNGVFCFTADYTGLQTFYDEYAAADDAFPLCTMAEWGWHSYPPRPGDEAGLRLTPYNTYERAVYYASDDTGQEERFKRVRQSAHKFNLAKIAFAYEGRPLSLRECKPARQILNMWEGILYSEFSISGHNVAAETFVHPDRDMVYVKVNSPLIKANKLAITITFPYGSHRKSAADFDSPREHSTAYNAPSRRVDRKLDDTEYRVLLAGSGFAADACCESHTVIITPQDEKLAIALEFEPVTIPVMDRGSAAVSKEPADSFAGARERCRAFWESWWNTGGAMDFSASSDRRAGELERRVVLSQYLMAIQSRGVLPPAETGLSCNSWYGKFHLEMRYWHCAWFALWNRTEELKRGLGYYKKILPRAREIAASQGYAGARWPKMCDPSGSNTPSSIAVLLIWQQPHPIMLAELCYRACPGRPFLDEYREIVVETAEFMKSFVHWEADTGCYALGPPYIPAQERHDPRITLNAAYELEYFRWAFKTADAWLARLGEAPRYTPIAAKLALPAQKDGLYLAHENCPDTFSKLPFYTDHPSMLAMYGVLDSEKIEAQTMSATLDKVLEVWDKTTFYGWDFSMMAMTACRLGRLDDALAILLMDSPKNTWMANGHNPMVGDAALPLYLPGNGGLLLAAAMLAAGYGNKKTSSFPEGFTVQSEGINAYI